jgi:hypothetical protein
MLQVCEENGGGRDELLCGLRGLRCGVEPFKKLAPQQLIRALTMGVQLLERRDSLQDDIVQRAKDAIRAEVDLLLSL